MLKFWIYDDCGTEAFSEEIVCNSFSEAIEIAKEEFEKMSAIDQKRRVAFYAVEAEETEDGEIALDEWKSSRDVKNERHELTIEEFVADLYSNAIEALDEMTIEDAKIDLANFEREDWELPKGITPKAYMDEYNRLVEHTIEVWGIFDQAVELMDDEIRERVHAEVAPCSKVHFLNEYRKRHLEKYGERFEY